MAHQVLSQRKICMSHEIRCYLPFLTHYPQYYLENENESFENLNVGPTRSIVIEMNVRLGWESALSCSYCKILCSCFHGITVTLRLSLMNALCFVAVFKVKKVMSLQPQRTYYPAICFSGDCRYRLCWLFISNTSMRYHIQLPSPSRCYTLDFYFCENWPKVRVCLFAWCLL